MGSVQVISDTEFDGAVLQADQSVLVYFWAPWCGPCRLMSPVMDKMAAQYSDRLKIVKMEVDPNPESVARCKVQGVPALVLFQKGEQIVASEGAIPQTKIEEILSPHL